jgi:hypothetical protein
MSHSVVHAVFFNNNDAAGAIGALTSAGFSPSQLSVIGKDSDDFRVATATLESTKANRLMIVLGIAGAFVGSIIGATGVHFVPGFDATYITPVTLTTSFAGIAVGMVTGLATGAIVQLDNIPESEAEVRLGSVQDGDMAVSISTKDAAELERAQTILRDNGAKHIAFDFTAEVLQAARPAPELALSSVA